MHKRFVIYSSVFGLTTIIAAATYITQKIRTILSQPIEMHGVISSPNTLVNTDLGSVIGFDTDRGSYAWYGIRYAEAERWHAPEAAKPWNGTKTALTAGSPCPQLNPTDFRFGLDENERGKPIGSEDCLFLNVYTPKQHFDASINLKDSTLPVMVFFHFGGNSVGWGSRLDLSKFAAEMNSVVVSMNYRLGMFGWFYHPSLHSDSTHASPLDRSGNFGTLDMIEGLRWVNSNIHNFGGNKNNVTLFGGSSGAKSVMSMLFTPLSKGLFNKGIILSGLTDGITLDQASGFIDETPYTIEYSSSEILLKLINKKEKYNSRKLAKNHINQLSDSNIHDLLFGTSMEEMLSVVTPDNYGKYSDTYFYYDGSVFPKTPFFETLANGPVPNPVPLIIGTTRDETKLFQLMDDSLLNHELFGLKVEPKDQKYYDALAKYVTYGLYRFPAHYFATHYSNKSNSSLYQYQFDWDDHPDDFVVERLIMDLDKTIGACHMIDIPFLINDFSSNSIGFPLIFVGTHDTKNRDVLASSYQSYIKYFVHDGNPNQNKNINQKNPHKDWVKWSELQGGHYLIFDNKKVELSNNTLTKQSILLELDNDDSINIDQKCNILSKMIDIENNFSIREKYFGEIIYSEIISQCRNIEESIYKNYNHDMETKN